MIGQLQGGVLLKATAPLLSENDWHKDELLMEIKRLKANKSADEKGLVDWTFQWFDAFSTITY